MWLDAVVLVHQLVHAPVETVAGNARILLVLRIELVVYIALAAHNSGVIIVVNILLVGCGGTALDLGGLDLLGVVRAAPAVVRAASHFYKDFIYYSQSICVFILF